MSKLQCALVGAMLCVAAPAWADVPQVKYVTSCGAQSNTAGALGVMYATTTGQLCISGSISATIGAFAPGGTYLNVASITGTSANSALPAGANILVYNTGANPIMVKLSTSGATTVTSATADAVIQPSSTQELATGSNTNIAYAATTSTSSMQVVGGAGIAAGWGGGTSSGGGGGNVNLNQVGGVSYALGQTTMSASMPIAIASNQSALPASQSGTWNITNVSGTVSLPTGASTSALQPTNAAQGSTTSGQTGNLAMGAVTTGAPTYTTAQTSPISLDTAGNLRVNVVAGGGSGGTSSSFGSAFPATGTAIGVTDGTNMRALAGVHVGTVYNAGIDISSLAGTVLTAVPSAYGTAPTGTVQGENSFVTNAGSVSAPWITGYSVAGTPTVAPGTAYGPDVDCNVSSTLCTLLSQGVANWGSAYSSTGASIALGGYDGTDLRPISTNTSGQIILGAQTAAAGGDPCTSATKSNAAFSSASGTFAIVTGVSAKKIYVCSIVAVTPSAVSISLAEGSSSTCGTSNQAAVIGVATSGTASQGMPFAANGGLALGTGAGTIASTATAADYLCIFQSGTAQIAGNVSYVQQ